MLPRIGVAKPALPLCSPPLQGVSATSAARPWGAFDQGFVQFMMLHLKVWDSQSVKYKLICSVFPTEVLTCCGRC